ncbi:MAG: endonuclease/exonuclease/phosphatase family protein [Chromatiales bacterium]|jgi:endonuclease/exonuclease/phosphatase family metal-dependent hydrolase
MNTFVAIACTLLLLSETVLISACSSGNASKQSIAERNGYLHGTDSRLNVERKEEGILKLLSLNIAHGRKEAINQLLLSEETIRHNLLAIADVIAREDIDIVALQEADGPSAWSGNFDHVDLIARRAGYPWHFRADHATSWLFSYGTAILSRWPVSEIIEHTFTPSPPTFNKGFLLGVMTWSASPDADKERQIDIISVHLDFSSKQVRERQITEIADILSERNNPIIILGDFNSEWSSERSAVKLLAVKAQMKAYQPRDGNLSTYPKRGTRLDWILISNELDFVSYQVLPDPLSDHLAVVAEVKLME